MILFNNDIPIIPNKVRLEERRLYDESLNQSYPINESGHYILSLVNGKKTIKDISIKVAERYDIEEEFAGEETIKFLVQMSENFIINISKGTIKTRVKMGLSFFILLQFKEVFNLFDNRRRYDLPDIARNPIILFFYLLIKIPLYHPYLYLFIIGMFLLAGDTLYNSIFFSVNIFVSVSIHEYSHILALYLMGEKNKLAFIGRKSFTIGVYRERIEPLKDIIVSLSGPIVPTIIGCILVLNTNSYMLNFIGFIWISNIFTLVIGVDGKNILNSSKTLIWNRG